MRRWWVWMGGAGVACAWGLGIWSDARAQGAPPPPPTLEVSWIDAPGPADIARAVREAGLDPTSQGRVVIDCQVAADGALADCQVAEEAPADKGLGPAALSLSARFRLASPAALSPGQGRIRVPVRFDVLGPEPGESLAATGRPPPLLSASPEPMGPELAAAIGAPAPPIPQADAAEADDPAPTLPPPSPPVTRQVLEKVGRKTGGP